nr:D-ala D-ala ligase C-terminus [uncultured bacterium]
MAQRKTARVAVLGGGNSPEREVSLRSARAVSAALSQAGYEVSELDPSHYDTDSLIAQLAGFDVVFPVLHGKGGEDGTVQALLESIGMPFVGAGADVSALCFDKTAYKAHLQELGLSLPFGVVVDRNTVWSQELTKSPFVLKPYDGGSSVDTFIIRDPQACDRAAIEDALDRHHTMLLEELIIGTEITVGVVGEEALPVIEIIPPADQEFDYENKYNGQTQELCPPQHVEESVQITARQLAAHIHTRLNIRDFSRTDLMIRQGDDRLFILETNTIPGMTDQSLLPKAAKTAGYDMAVLCDRLVSAALERK